MRVVGHAGAVKRRCYFGRVLVIHLAVACLILSLASRVFYPPLGRTIAAQCNSPKAKIQHLAEDAFAWAAPTEGFLPPWFPPSTRRVLHRDQPPLLWHLDGTLYDRPPPIS